MGSEMCIRDSLMHEFGMVEFGVEDIVRSGLIRSYLLNKIALGL